MAEQKFIPPKLAFLVGWGINSFYPQISSLEELSRATSLYQQTRPQAGLCQMPTSQTPEVIFKAFHSVLARTLWLSEALAFSLEM